MPDRLNILFLMSDEHRFDVAGFAGDPVVRTPFLDRLAADGVVFDNAYTPSPICIPGRQAMMAGQFPRTCGCTAFGQDLAPGSMTFARQFARHAYRTVCSGKLHHTGPDQMQGWTDRIAPDASVADSFIEDRVDAEFAKYSPAPGTGKWTNQKEIERAGVQTGPYQQMDRMAVEAAEWFVEKYFNDPGYDRPMDHRPLLLKVSLVQPHYPFFAEDADAFNYYLNRVPIFQEPRTDHPVLGRTQCGPDVEASERDIRRATAAYYAMTEQIDEHFARVAAAIENTGQDLDDWIIVYTSDHGDMLGQHGIWEKTRFYEGSVRVPLIIRWPERFGGRRVAENVNLCDLFATLCDLAGLPVPDGRDSRSLVPLLEGDVSAWDNESVSQFKDHTMIRRDALKYQHYGDAGPEVLFDLEADPGETRNVLEEPAYAEAVTRFRQRRADLAGPGDR